MDVCLNTNYYQLSMEIFCDSFSHYKALGMLQ